MRTVSAHAAARPIEPEYFGSSSWAVMLVASSVRRRSAVKAIWLWTWRCQAEVLAIRNVVNRVLTSRVADTDDIFLKGCDR